MLTLSSRAQRAASGGGGALSLQGMLPFLVEVNVLLIPREETYLFSYLSEPVGNTPQLGMTVICGVVLWESRSPIT
jgi:hypothetical protein